MSEFVFADSYRLEPGPTRDFYQMFMKGLVHKQNNLMGVIQGFSSLILYEDDLDPTVRENAQQMQDSAKAASDMNKEILAASGSNFGNVEDPNDSVQLGDMLPFLTEKLEGICSEHGVGFQLNSKTIPAVVGDSGHVNEILTRLVLNAAEAAKDVENGAVAVDIFAPGEASPGSNVDLFVRNNCSELTEGDLNRAFEPFHTTKTAEHVGLGLTTAAVYAGQMGMRIGVRYADNMFTSWLAMPPASA